MDLVILNRSQITRTAPELAPPLQVSAPHQRDGVWLTTSELACTRPTYTVESGFGPGVLRLWSRDLATRSPRPPVKHGEAIPNCKQRYICLRYCNDSGNKIITFIRNMSSYNSNLYFIGRRCFHHIFHSLKLRIRVIHR
ncbi:hypothetical protein AVEN_222509-1, partial [Araneus ventricosus]